MSGLGGLNKSPNGVVIGLVQLQLPVVATADDLARQTEKVVAMVAKARRSMPPWTWSCSRNTRSTACRWTPTPRSW